jgi:histidine triad (HIT) family protein
MNDDCIFCKIVKGDLPAQIVFQDGEVTAFRDINPVKPVHILIIPNRHIASTNALTEADEALIGRLVNVGRQLAADEGVDESGYRLVINTGPQAGQTVYHLHLHLLGGQEMPFH